MPSYDYPDDYERHYLHLDKRLFSTHNATNHAARVLVIPGYEDMTKRGKETAWAAFISQEKEKSGLNQQKLDEMGALTYLQYLQNKKNPRETDLKRIQILKQFDFNRFNSGRFINKITSNAHLISKSKAFITASCGATNSSKTNGNLQYTINFCRSNKLPKPWGIGSRTIPHLQGGVIPDFRRIMQDWKLFDSDAWRSNPPRYTFKNGTELRFVPLDDGDKYAGPRWSGFFFNELNRGIPYDAVVQIIGRTDLKVLMDWNPTAPFYFHEKMLTDPNLEIDYLDELNYLGNETLTMEQMRSMDIYRQDEYRFNVYIKGMMGNTTDIIYPNITILEQDANGRAIPETANLLGYGLDFGGAGSKSSAMALTSLYQWGDAFIANQELYSYDMDSRQVGVYLLGKRDNKPVIADFGNLEGIKILRGMGVNVIKCIKGGGSIDTGVSLINSLPVFITEASVNMLEEKNSYTWKRDRNDTTLNVPDPNCKDDLMDAMRYSFQLISRNISQLGNEKRHVQPSKLQNFLQTKGYRTPNPM